jgi:hypothetical protein
MRASSFEMNFGYKNNRGSRRNKTFLMSIIVQLNCLTSKGCIIYELEQLDRKFG